MKKSYLPSYFSENRNKVVPLAAICALMSSFATAQTPQQVQRIQKNTKISNLNRLAKEFNKNEPNVEVLKKTAINKGYLFSGTVDGNYFQLKGFDKNDKPIYYITTNSGAASTTMTANLHSDFGIFNLDGENMRVHEWDGGGILMAHQEYGGRAENKDNPSKISEHATHVGGTMIASGIMANAKGMAPKAFLDAYDWNNDAEEMAQAAINGALVSNHSYGLMGGFVLGNYAGPTGWYWLGDDEDTEYRYYGKYSTKDISYDLIAVNAPYYLQVKAAGNPRGLGPNPGGLHYVQVYNNDENKYEWKKSNKVRQKNGGEDGFDSVNRGALGKNILVVGAAEKITNGYVSPEDVKMASFSGYGPVDDGRIKPDITGVGVDVYSSSSQASNAYATLSGTSMASPNVTGSLLLLQEHYKNENNGDFMKSATLKALVIATANEAGSNPGPDYSSGWGLLNSLKAATAISTNNKYSLIQEKTLNNDDEQTISVTASGAEPLVVTIAWIDPVSDKLPTESLNDRTSVLVNDLDVRVFKDGTEFYPWKLNPAVPAAAATKGDNTVDNVEQIVIPNPVANGTYEIKVSHKGHLKTSKVEIDNNGLGVTLMDADSQDYSLVVTGINNNVNNDLSLNSVKVDVSPKNYSAETPVTIEVSNKGAQAVSGAKVKYELINSDNNQVEQSNTIDLGDVSFGQTLKKSFNVDLSKSFINYKIKATIIYDEDQIVINNISEANAFGIVSDLTEEGTSTQFGFEDSLKKYGWTSEDVNNDGNTWVKYDKVEFANNGNSFAINFPYNKAANDWLFSNPIKVKANTKYRIILNVKKFRSTAEKLSLFVGKQSDHESMQTKIGTVEATGLNYDRYILEYTTTESGIVYFGFQHNAPVGQTYAIALDDVSFQNAEGIAFPDFQANNVNPNTFETVVFNNLTIAPEDAPVTSYNWIFEPNTVTYQNGTNQNSENPEVIFNTEDDYDVTLVATNSKGENEILKNDYIVAQNQATHAEFIASDLEISEGETVTFTSVSDGNPKPTEFNWTITPSDGVELINSSDSNIEVTYKFNKPGDYSVSLEAISAFNSDTSVKQNLLHVFSSHESVVNLKGEVDNDKVKLTWERPRLRPLYVEGFEGSNFFLPESMTTIDEDGDGANWVALSVPDLPHSGLVAAVSISSDVNDGLSNWLLTDKINAGAEVLKFWQSNIYKENLKVYVVPVSNTGNAPTLEEVKAGQLVYDAVIADTGNQQQNTVEIVLDIKDYTSTDFYIAFLHHKDAGDSDGIYLSLDDIEVGFVNSEGVNFTPLKVVAPKEEEGKILSEKMPETILNKLNDSKTNDSFSNQTKALETFDLPYVTGYEVARNGNLISTVEETEYVDTVPQNGVYSYDVYVLYSDGLKSPKSTISIEINNLATNNIDGSNGFRVYPNPSNGLFIIENKQASSFEADIYDLTGKLIQHKNFVGNKAELNLLQFSKGVYILSTKDDSGNKQSMKLIIK